MRAVELLLDGHHGIYVPQAFAEMIVLDLWEGITHEDLDILKQGPENDAYWETWANVLDNACAQVSGRVYRLYQDGDLWAYCPEMMSEEEKENLFAFV